MAENIATLTKKLQDLEERVGNVANLLIDLCHQKGQDNLPKKYNIKPYVLTKNDMTKYKEAG